MSVWPEMTCWATWVPDSKVETRTSTFSSEKYLRASATASVANPEFQVGVAMATLSTVRPSAVTSGSFDPQATAVLQARTTAAVRPTRDLSLMSLPPGSRRYGVLVGVQDEAGTGREVRPRRAEDVDELVAAGTHGLGGVHRRRRDHRDRRAADLDVLVGQPFAHPLGPGGPDVVDELAL